MVRRMLIVSIASLLALTAPALAGGCKGCSKVAKSGEGFCCGKGMAFGVEIGSKKLHAALVGNKVDPAQAEKCPCDDCKKAFKTNGKCDKCKFVAGKLYQSPVSYALAKGTTISAELVAACPKRCGQCKTAHKNNGRCEHCGVGFVAGRMYDNAEDHEAALLAYKTLTKAAKIAKKCVDCAIALVTDGTCEGCNVSFKNGKVASNTG